MLRSAIRQILFSQPVKPIVSINGTQGLALDAAGGALTNGRTSTATYIDANGVLQTAAANALVFENGALRHEGAATNLYVWSNKFDDPSWTKIGTPVLTQNVTGPDGVANSAWTVTDDSAAATEAIYRNIACVAGEVYTTQLFIKKTTGAQSSYPVFSLEPGGANIAPYTVDTSNGIMTRWTAYTGFTILDSTHTIISVGDYWLCTITTTIPVGQVTIHGVIYVAGAATADKSSGVLDVTLTGSAVIYEFDLKKAANPSSSIHTTTAAVTRATDSISLPVVQDTNFYQAQGITLIKCKMKFANSAGNKAILAINTGATDLLYDNGSGGIALGDGTNTATAAVGGWAVDDTLLIAACRNSRNGLMSVHVSKNGGAWVDSADTAYDGAVSAGANILLSSANTDSIEFNHVKLYKTTKSFAAMQRWIKAKAAQETA